MTGRPAMNIHAVLIGLLSVAHTPAQAEHAAREVLTMHAHQLAEQQRAWAREGGLPVQIDSDQLPSIVEAAVLVAADLIDPKAHR